MASQTAAQADEHAAEDGLEAGLQPILKASGAVAAAVCLFDQRLSQLRLASEIGLSDEGRQRLRLVRRGNAGGWEMPLHGLLNRRVYLIENANKNPFVPQLVEAFSSVRTVACVPLYSAATPLGSLILVASGPRALRERELRNIEEPMRALVQLILESQKRRAPDAAPVAPWLGGPTASASGRSQPRMPGGPMGPSSNRPSPALEEERLRAQLAEAETALASERERVRVWERERERAEEVLKAAAERERGLVEQLEAATQRGASAHHHLEGAGTQQDLEALQEEARGARAELQRLEAAERAARAEHDRVATELEDVRRREGEATTRLTQLEREVTALRDVRDAELRTLAARLESVTAERDQLRVALTGVAGGDVVPVDDAAHVEGSAQVGSVENLRAQLIQAEAALASEQARVHEWEREHSRVENALEGAAERERRLQEELEAATKRGFAAGNDLEQARESARRADEARAAAAAEAKAAHTALEEMQKTLAALQAEERGARAEIARLDAAERAARAEQATVARELQGVRAREEEVTARLSGLEREHERAEQALQAAAEREQRLREDMEAASYHGRSANQDIGRARESARMAEEARAAADAEAKVARAEIARLETAERMARAEQDRVASELADVRTREEQATTRLNGLEREHLRAEDALRAAAEREQRLQAELEAATRRGETADLDLERARDAARLAEEARAAAAAEAETAHAALAQADKTLEALQGEARGAQAEVARLEAAEAEARAERERMASELQEVRAREGEATGRLATLEQEVATLREASDAEVRALAARLETVGAERDQLRAALAIADEEARRALADQAEQKPVAVDRVVAAPAPVAPEPAPQRVRRASTTGERRIVVLDADPEWQRLAAEGRSVLVVRPEDASGDGLDEAAPSLIVANLATPGVFDALLAIRAAGWDLPFQACLAAPSADRAIPLGAVEPAARPLDPTAVLSSLGASGSRGTRVVTVGADVDALMGLREALSRRGMSVSMAWDAKQATDLLAMVRPEVAVVDLALPPREGCTIIARLSSAEGVRSIVLIRGSEDPAAGFGAALTDAQHAHRAVSLARLFTKLLGRSAESASVPSPK